MSKRSLLRNIGLQFFAEDPPADPPTDPKDNPPTDPPADPNEGKTFTQEEVNKMLAAEKRQGRQAALKALGLDPADKDAEKKAKEILDAQKTQQERDQEALNTEKTARTEAEAKAQSSERKLLALTAGCKKELVDEVVALAIVKVNDTTDFEAALNTVKEKMPTLFEDEVDTGTGGGQGHQRREKGDKPGSLGTRLAQKTSSQKGQNNPYFS